MKYNFFYDESEHSRKINHKTITSENYSDNFVTAVVGWSENYSDIITEKYLKFEEKYKDRMSKGELKSSAIRSKKLKYGFASLDWGNINLLNDFLSLFDENIYIYFSAVSKVEYVILQLFCDYKNSILIDADAMKYSLTKAILTYKPDKVLEYMYHEQTNLIPEICNFLRDRIEQNKKNISLKKAENGAFEQLLSLLNNIKDINSLEWNYTIAFEGLKKYLHNQGIEEYTVTLDKEGEHEKTCNAAKDVGLKNVEEADSKDMIGIRMADMLAGLISKFFKALFNALHPEKDSVDVKKTILDKAWFDLKEEQLVLYKKMHQIIVQINNDWYKSYSGIYADDLIAFIALLDFMNNFESSEKIRENIDIWGDRFNKYSCERLAEYFALMKHKRPIEPILDKTQEFFLNQRGAKVYYDIEKQPYLPFENNQNKSYVLSVGFNRQGIPLVTIQEKTEAICYRLPKKLEGWALTLYEWADRGTNLLPAMVLFSKRGNQYFADLL